MKASLDHKEKIGFGLFSLLFLAALVASIVAEQYLLLIIPFLLVFFYWGWLNINSVFLLLIVSLPFSFEYNFTSSLGTDIPDEGLMLLTSLFFFCYWLSKPAAIKRQAAFHPLVIFLFIQLGWIVIASLYSTDNILSLKYILAKGWYVAAFIMAPLIVLTNERRIAFMAKLLTSSMFFIVVLALIKHGTNDFRFIAINDAVAPFFRNHVAYSSMLVCIIPVLFAFYKSSKNKNTKQLLLAGLVIMLTALFFSYARGAWLALFAGAITYWLVKKRLLLTTYVIGITLLILCVAWLRTGDRYLDYAHDYRTTIFHQDFKDHLVATYKFKDVSTAERFYRWIAGLRMLDENYITGFGPNTFYLNYKAYTIPAFKTWVSDNPDHSTVHNYFLLLAIEQGIPGMILFMLLVGAMLYYAQFLYHKTVSAFYKTTAITIAAMLVMITVVNLLSDLIETDKIGSLFFLCLSLLIITDIKTRQQS